MDTEPGDGNFVHFRLRGGRFEHGRGLPLTAASELAAYQDLVAATARTLFMRDNPRRRRLPRGFSSRLDLRLVRLEGGSVTTMVERVTPVGQLPLDDEFTRTRDLINDAIVATASGGTLPDLFSERVRSAFGRFGQTLESDERIELGSPGGERRISYDREVRRRLLIMGTKSYTESGSIIG
ncbi:hypothetical protein, partial [Candidatus Protofrankia datiscae]